MSDKADVVRIDVNINEMSFKFQVNGSTSKSQNVSSVSTTAHNDIHRERIISKEHRPSHIFDAQIIFSPFDIRCTTIKFNHFGE